MTESFKTMEICNEPVLYSILENDLYKFSMSHYYQMVNPLATGKFAFKDRNNMVFTQDFVEILRKAFKHLVNLHLTKEEFNWCLINMPYIPQCYFEWLQGFRFNPDLIQISLDCDGHLQIEVQDLIYKATLYEMPILSTVSEMYYRYKGYSVKDWAYIDEQLAHKVELSDNHQLKYANFGLRRRFSHEVEDHVTDYLVRNSKYFVGSSTVSFAMKYQSVKPNFKPIGTMAHELIMASGAMYGPREANYIVMRNWAHVYGGSLGVMLTDCFTTDVFLRNFSMDMAKLYDGVRHDSGDPFVFGDKMIEKYKSYNINPMTKSIVFSDALDFEKMVAINDYFKGRINLSFGIGTNLTNDCGYEPLNIVMKLVSFRVNPRQPEFKCVKLSDVCGKEIGDPQEIDLYKRMLGITLNQ